MTVLRSWDNISSRKVIFRQKNTRTKAYRGEHIAEQSPSLWHVWEPEIDLWLMDV